MTGVACILFNTEWLTSPSYATLYYCLSKNTINPSSPDFINRICASSQAIRWLDRTFPVAYLNHDRQPNSTRHFHAPTLTLTRTQYGIRTSISLLRLQRVFHWQANVYADQCIYDLRLYSQQNRPFVIVGRNTIGALYTCSCWSLQVVKDTFTTKCEVQRLMTLAKQLKTRMPWLVSIPENSDM